MKISEKFGTIKISGTSVDDAIVMHVKKNGGIVATIDTELKNRIKESSGTILSLANDRIVLEESKI